MKTGRNDPCPCGSGKKYKKCCISVAQTVNDELAELLSNQEFDSLEDVQSAVDSLMVNQNQKPQDDFLGLSSDQVYKMLHFAFDSPELFQFAEQLSLEPEAPIIMLIEGIVSAIDDKGLKATKVKGCLPQKLCRELWQEYKKISSHDIHASFRKVNKEDDFFELYIARIVLELAGFLRKTKGYFYVTQKYKKVMKKSGLKGLYPLIFKTYCREFNWAYWDHFDEVPFIQQSFLFTLFLLQYHGDKMTFTSVYEDDFLRAFPMVIDEISETTYSTPEKQLRYCYYYRACLHFMVFLGLAEIEVVKGEKAYNNKSKIQKTPLLDGLLQFKLNAVKPSKTVH